MTGVTAQTPRVGVVGLGVMGSALAHRLLDRLGRLAVHDVRPDAAREHEQSGASAHPDPASLAEAVDVVVLSLNTAAVVDAVVRGPRGLLAGRRDADRRPLLIVDMSSIDPAATRDLAVAAGRAGAGWVDAPLSGGAPAALAGRLSLMVGGDDADVRRAREVLGHVANRVTHLGPAGSGQVVKLVNQVLVGTAFSAIAEAAALVRAGGLAPDQVVAALTGGRADSPLLQEFFVKFATGDLTPTGRIGNMVKDLDTALEHARKAGIPMPLTTLVCELNRWLVAQGLEDADSAALMGFFDRSLLSGALGAAGAR